MNSPPELAVLAGYVALHAWCGSTSLKPVYPPESLGDAQIELLNQHLRDAMPLGSMITDLWDRDCHFEDELDCDWLYGAAFGPESDVVAHAAVLAEYFMGKVDAYDMDYNQWEDPEGFAELVAENAAQFVREWRKTLCRSLLAIDV